MGFRQPNKTKTFFSQVNAGRQATAKQAMGAPVTSLVQNQAQAQQKENENVQKAQQQMVATTDKTIEQGEKVKQFENLGNTDPNTAKATFDTKFAPTAMGGLQVAKAADARVQVDRSPYIGGGTQTGMVTQQTLVNPSAQPTPGPRRELSAFEKLQQGAALTATNMDKAVGQGLGRVESEVAGASKAVNDAVAQASTIAKVFGINSAEYQKAAQDEIAAREQAAMAQKKLEEERLTQGNLGQLGMESASEQAMLDRARVLASEEGSVGKLRALFGGRSIGNTELEQALNANILQEQINKATEEAQGALAKRESARSEGARVRDEYLAQAGRERELIQESKKKADAKIAESKTKVDAINAEMKRLQGVNSEAAKAELKRLKDAKDAEQKKINDAANALKRYNQMMQDQKKKEFEDKNTQELYRKARIKEENKRRDAENNPFNKAFWKLD